MSGEQRIRVDGRKLKGREGEEEIRRDERRKEQTGKCRRDTGSETKKEESG